MKKLLLAAVAVVAGVTTISPPAFAAEVGVSISVGQPGFYGQLDIGDYPRPQVIYRQPMMVDRVEMDRPPIYMRVPPGHAKHWRKHCGKYNACAERVLFVRDSWYNREYAPHYRRQHDDRQEGRREQTGGNDRQGDHHDRGNGRNR